MTAAFPTTRQEAHRRAQQFISRAGSHYAQFRNFDQSPSPRTYVSELSPALRYRLLTEAELLRITLAHHSLEDAEKFCQEVLWRTYWRSWLELRPQVWRSYCKFLRESDAERHHHRVYQETISGRSHIPCLNNWVYELKERGYLHNHARMWFASIWVFTLNLPWQWGARFFLEHLFDGDPASNTLSWRWIAGLHTKGKSYLATAPNIARFSQFSIDSSLLAASAQAISEDLDLSPQALPTSIEHNLSTAITKDQILVLAGDDLSPQTISGLLNSSWKAIACLDESAINKVFPKSELARTYYRDITQKALKEWAESAGHLPHFISTATELRQLQAALGTQNLTILAPPVGPHADTLATVLEGQAHVCLIRRAFDQDLLSFGYKGFFDFWKQVRPLLNGDLLTSDARLKAEKTDTFTCA